MSFEKPELSSKPLHEEEAHEEANLLRSHLGVDLESGKMTRPPRDEVEGVVDEGVELHFVEREPTAEDYDKAAQALAQLKEELRSESSAWMRGIIRANQLTRTFGLAGLYAGRALSAAIDAIKPKESRRSFKESWRARKNLTDAEWGEVFHDAESRLKRLRVAARTSGSKEKSRQ